MADTTKITLGPCSVTYNNLDLGHTEGGVEISYEPVFKEVMADKYGETPVQKYLIGEKFTAVVRLTEYTIANLRNAIPQSEFAGAANARITIGKSAGQGMLARAYQLVLHPINQGTRQHDIVLHKAVVTSQVTLNHKIDEQKIIEVTFEAMIDETKSDGNYLGLIGDSTA